MVKVRLSRVSLPLYWTIWTSGQFVPSAPLCHMMTKVCGTISAIISPSRWLPMTPPPPHQETLVHCWPQIWYRVDFWSITLIFGSFQQGWLFPNLWVNFFQWPLHHLIKRRALLAADMTPGGFLKSKFLLCFLPAGVAFYQSEVAADLTQGGLANGHLSLALSGGLYCHFLRQVCSAMIEMLKIHSLTPYQNSFLMTTPVSFAQQLKLVWWW